MKAFGFLDRCAAGIASLRSGRLRINSLLVASIVSIAALLPAARAADPFFGADPAWTLLHEPAVERELTLPPATAREFRGLLGEFDAKVFPLRNRPTAEGVEGVRTALAELTTRLETVLPAARFRRWTEIENRQRGTAALLRPALTALMDYSPRQRERLEQVIAEAATATKDLERRAAEGQPRDALDREYTRLKKTELEQVGGILTPRQRALWQKAVGRDFDLGSLGHARFKAPELVDSGEWINSEPLSIASAAGKVVVVHFYAFGCINCVRNFPTYVDWQERFREKDVVIVGIHTPETASEQDATLVRAKAAEAGFTFPVLIDREKATWNAWGNSMWPSVYLIDKRGFLRHFWPGELKWQGATGDVWMRERIDELLAESPRP